MKKVFQNIGNWIKKAWKGSMDVFKTNGIPISVMVVNVLKEVVEAGYGDVLVNLTKTKIDNQVLEFLKVWIPKIAMELAVTEVLINAGSTDSEIISALAGWLAKQNLSVRATFYAGFAAKLNIALADGKISFSEGISLGQFLYDNISK